MIVNPTLKNPALPSSTDLLDSLKREVMKELNAVRIGVIQAFDAGGAGDTANVTVQLAQQQVISTAPDGTRTIQEYPLLLKVPVYFPCGGGFTLTFPIAKGDECIVLFNDRELDNWLLTGAGQAPTTGRVHDFSDAMALVGMRSNPRALLGISTTSTQLRSDDGGTFVEIAAGGVVNIVAPTAINLTAHTINLNASTEVNIDTPLTNITGVIVGENEGGSGEPFTINGNVRIVGGGLVSDGNIVGNGISLDGHIHTNGNAGADTGPPVP